MKQDCFFCQRKIACPIHTRDHFVKSRQIKEVKEIISASPPTVFVGSALKYPKVNIGVLSPLYDTKENWVYDAQSYWSDENYSIPQIVDLRKQLINSRTQVAVKDLNYNKSISSFQEIAMSSRPVSIELELKQKLKENINFDKIMLPSGPTAYLDKIKITANPKIPQKIEKVYSDTDLKAIDALNYLSQSGFDNQMLSQLMSVGVLGQKNKRKLVPTRYSITATDDIISRELIKKVKDFNQIENVTLYFGSYLGNYYFIFFIPSIFSYELFETYLPSSKFQIPKPLTDYESYFGRKSYATNTVGGYYACRLAILEKLSQIKKQASVLALRFITSEYTTPLGVFVVRQATRKSLISKIEFESLNQALNYCKTIIKSKFDYNPDNIFETSKLLKNQNQTNLSKFI